MVRRQRGRLALFLVLGLVVSACEWSGLGFDAARTGDNVFEATITPANVGSLVERWTAAIGTGPTGVDAAWSPAVGNDIVVVGSNDGKLRAFDRNGVAGCAGSPTVCQPKWTANPGGAPLTPTIAGPFVYVTAGGTLFAY